jgi:hypothetical protein
MTQKSTEAQDDRTACSCPYCVLTRTLQMENLIGSEAAAHLRRSQKEVLLALRGAIDAAIRNLERKSEPPRAEKIDVR